MYSRSLKVIILILASQSAVLMAAAQDNAIFWTPTKGLEWNDFKGTPDQASPFYAETKTRINYTTNYDADGKITFTLKCAFQAEKAWKKTDKTLTPELLRHEQGHFNISEVFARKMRKAFSEYCSTHKRCATTSTDFTAIFQHGLDELHAMEVQYDLETDHSKVPAKQQEWNTKIAAMLSELAAYAQN